MKPLALAPSWDGPLLAAAALVSYLLLGQSTPFKIDGEILLFMHARGTPNATYHYFFPILLNAADTTLGPLGLNLFRIGCVLSAVGTAIGVIGVHAAGRMLGLDRREALLAAAFAASCPAWMFFATVVEVHGPFLPFAGLAFLAISWLVRHGGNLRALTAGLAIGAAYLAHPSGALLLGTIPVLAAIARQRGLLGDFRLVRHSLLALATVLMIIATIPRMLVLLGRGSAPSIPLRYVIDNFETVIDWRGWLSTLLHELAIPYGPLVVLLGIALIGNRTRRPALWMALATFPYLLICQVVMHYGGELGAYMLPIAWPIALCAMPLLRNRPRLAAASLVVALGLGTTMIRAHDDPRPIQAYANGLRSIGGEKPILVLGQYSDLAAYFMRLDELPLCFLGDIAQVEDAAQAKTVITAMHGIMEGYFDAGHRVFLPQGTLDALDESARSGKWPMVGKRSGVAPGDHLMGKPIGPRLFKEFLAANYHLEPVAADGFAGSELVRRR